MASEIRMPALGQTTDELLIVRWLKAEGDSIRIGEPLLEVETDKATLEVESSAAGTLLKIHFPPETMVEAGTVIAVVGAPNEPHQAILHAPDSPSARPDGVPDSIQRPLPQGPQLLATPVARLMARTNGVDLRLVTPTGRGGVIEKRDVEAFLQGGAPAYTDESIPRHRVVLAERLTRSVQTIPQIRLDATIRAGRLRESLEQARAGGLPDLTVTHLILRALSSALRQHPDLNARWLSEGPTLRRYVSPHVALAVAAGDRLLVVTIHEPDRGSLAELVARVQEAIQRARSGTLSPIDLEPAALTLSNLGMFGVDRFDAIVDPDQTAIVAAGRLMDQVVALPGGAIQSQPVMTLTLAVDHRVVDGAPAARFLQTVREVLEQG